MPFTADSRISDILSQRPDAKQLFEKYAGMAVSDSQLAMAQGMSLRQVGSFLGLDADKIEVMVGALND